MTAKTLSESKEKEVLASTRQLGRGVKDAGRQVWLAGLGALYGVGEGSQELVSDLIARGRRLEARERPVLEERFRRVGRRVGEFRDRLEQGVEDRVAGTLKRFGVPDRDEVHQLIDRIEELTRKIEGMTATAKS